LDGRGELWRYSTRTVPGDDEVNTEWPPLGGDVDEAVDPGAVGLIGFEEGADAIEQHQDSRFLHRP
jgi:hypothetical protein